LLLALFIYRFEARVDCFTMLYLGAEVVKDVSYSVCMCSCVCVCVCVYVCVCVCVKA
jgi:hypothetical protein